MNDEDPQYVRRDRMTFYPVVVMSTIFCVSIFIVIAATFGDPLNPVNKWVNHNANVFLLGETFLLMAAVLIAMTLDRIRTLERLARQQEAEPQATQESDPCPAFTEIESTSEERDHVD